MGFIEVVLVRHIDIPVGNLHFEFIFVPVASHPDPDVFAQWGPCLKVELQARKTQLKAVLRVSYKLVKRERMIE